MIDTLVGQAHAKKVPAVVFTLDPHPISLLSPGQVPPSLSTLARKAELLGSRGVDVLIAYPTDQALLDLSPEDFFRQVIRGELDAQGLVEGPNFCFGKDRAGDVKTLRQLCDRDGLTLTIVEAVTTAAETVVSSSQIRQAIGEGQIADAVAMLGHPYRLTGIVEPGARRGSGLGFPTANLSDVATLLPPDGVYAAHSEVDGGRYAAAVHLGSNPTFDDVTRKLEVHLVGFTGDLYGRPLSIDLIDRVRDTMRFEDVESLRSQLAVDVEFIRQTLMWDA